jgi:hypothetical protein
MVLQTKAFSAPGREVPQHDGVRGAVQGRLNHLGVVGLPRTIVCLETVTALINKHHPIADHTLYWHALFRAVISAVQVVALQTRCH